MSAFALQRVKLDRVLSVCLSPLSPSLCCLYLSPFSLSLCLFVCLSPLCLCCMSVSLPLPSLCQPVSFPSVCVSVCLSVSLPSLSVVCQSPLSPVLSVSLCLCLSLCLSLFPLCLFRLSVHLQTTPLPLFVFCLSPPSLSPHCSNVLDIKSDEFATR